MKVAIRATIELTPEQAEAWANEYGIENRPQAIREDIQLYVRTALHSMGAGLGSDTEVWTVKATPR